MNKNTLWLDFLERWSLEDYAGAINILKRLLSIEPQNPEYLAYLGLMYFFKEEINQAEYYFRKSLIYDSMNSIAWSNLERIQQGLAPQSQVTLPIPNEG